MTDLRRTVDEAARNVTGEVRKERIEVKDGIRPLAQRTADPAGGL
jgi:hypothetical protein